MIPSAALKPLIPPFTVLACIGISVTLAPRVGVAQEREPMVVEITQPGTGKEVPVKVGKFGLQMILRYDIGDASDLPVFPKLLYSIDQGDPSLLRWFVQRRYPNLLGTNVM